MPAVAPKEMLDVRNIFEAALLKVSGLKVFGKGVSMVGPPQADISVDYKGRSFTVSITQIVGR
jgi:hypothetical protein